MILRVVAKIDTLRRIRMHSIPFGFVTNSVNNMVGLATQGGGHFHHVQEDGYLEGGSSISVERRIQNSQWGPL